MDKARNFRNYKVWQDAVDYSTKVYQITDKMPWFEKKGLCDQLRRQLSLEMPGLRGFSARNLRNMRTFYEEWRVLDTNSSVETDELAGKLANVSAKTVAAGNLADASAKSQQNDNLAVMTAKTDNALAPLSLTNVPVAAFFSIGFSHHVLILSKVKTAEERNYYIQLCADLQLSHEALERKIAENAYAHRGNMPNNFSKTIPDLKQAFRAIQMFKDEYLLDYINVEQLGEREEDIDERVIENSIVHNIRNFIMTFGKGFSYIGCQVHYDKLGHDHWVDLLFFNRILRSLVVVELKKGTFKPGYLGQLSHYLHVLDDDERLEDENPPVGIILCRDADRTFVEYVLQDYQRPMGVATYTTSQERLRELLPDEEEMKRLMGKSE
jgi:predicted nuclease of restriction endonuclease-like (RecB) superfamily